jgi:Ca2+/Na+ antiporter
VFFIHLQEASEVGATGLLWLFLSYGYVLYYASNLISEGSDLLLLVPSMAGLVGGVVLPLLGAVPDGAIMLFSGLGDIETAQETLSVGVGALAGSTIMLLTVPWGLSVFGGRVNIDADGVPNYRSSPKLSKKTSIHQELVGTGVSISESVSHGGYVMMITTIPYFLIQVPAFFLHGPTEEIASGEHYWALGGLFVCLIGFVSYLYLQLQISQKGMDKGKRVAVVKKLLQEGQVSLSGALRASIQSNGGAPGSAQGYQSINKDDNYPDEAVGSYLKEILREAFLKYDANKNGTLDKKEVKTFFRDFHEDISDEEMDSLFTQFDSDLNGVVSFDEFIGACYVFITQKGEEEKVAAPTVGHLESTESATSEIAESIFDEDEEAEDVPEEFTDLSPDAQQAAIKTRAFMMLFIGTTLVIMFSDPMVDVMQEIAVRAGLSPFYVAFILAPLASNASEVLASQYYAAKKTRKTITVSLSALEGAASMNNTFCLSIFMALIYFRGLAWQYTAETISIVLVEMIIAIMVQKTVMTSKDAVIIIAIFPLSIILVAALEAIGFD